MNFVNALPYMLPCSHCGLDLAEFIRASEENEGTYAADCAASEEYGMPCQGPALACTNGTLLVNFFLRAHHNVDIHTKPCKPMWSPAQATAAYAEEQCAPRSAPQLPCVAASCLAQTLPSPNLNLHSSPSPLTLRPQVLRDGYCVGHLPTMQVAQRDRLRADGGRVIPSRAAPHKLIC